MSTHGTAPRRVPKWAGVAALGVVAAIVLVVGAALAFARPSQEATASPTAASASERPSPSPTDDPSPEAPSASPTTSAAARCPLDGEPLEGDPELAAPALAVQIENHPEARPPRNLANADVVIEAPVEGDTTRFTGIYLCEATSGLTGPVRSARYYNIDLWQELNALTVGYGRSDGAHARFVAAGMPYVNGMDGGPWFSRVAERVAPHNLFVDLEALRDDLDDNGSLVALADRAGAVRAPWSFSDDPDFPADGREVSGLEIRTNSFWRFGWEFDPALEAYLRSDAGEAVEDEATGEPLAFTSLIVQRVTQEVVYGDPDPGGNPRRLQHLVGSGEGMLYTRGRAYEIAWERPTAADGTTWTYAGSGDPVVLPPGEVWWHILPVDAAVTER